MAYLIRKTIADAKAKETTIAPSVLDKAGIHPPGPETEEGERPPIYKGPVPRHMGQRGAEISSSIPGRPPFSGRVPQGFSPGRLASLT